MSPEVQKFLDAAIAAGELSVASSGPYDFEQEPRILRPNGDFELHKGQKKVWASKKRHVAAVAGARSGKTCIGPWFVLRELQRQGGGDALVVGPSYPLMDRRLVPECVKVWQHHFRMGEYKAGRRCFEFNEVGLLMLGVRDARVWFGFAEDPESLESMEAICCWRDETGQSKFSRDAAEAIDRRLSMHRGRILDTSTPYAWNWWKDDVVDPGIRGHESIEVVNYESKDNPLFPVEEWEEQLKKLPTWKFDMMFRGQFTRPAGVIYDCFDLKEHAVPRFEIPKEWLKVSGHDFGQVHMGACFWAQDPATKIWYWYRSYLDGRKGNLEHVKEFRERAGLKPEGDGYYKHIPACGGATSEDSWREDFGRCGWPIQKPPIKDVEEGIARLYALIQTGKLKIFDDLAPTIDEIRRYSREIGPDGEPTAKIEDKEKYHRLDAARYLATFIYQGFAQLGLGGVTERFGDDSELWPDEYPEEEVSAFSHLGWS